MTKLDWTKNKKNIEAKKENHSKVYVENPKEVNAYMGIGRLIERIENKEWLEKRPARQERKKAFLYRELDRFIAILSSKPSFPGSKLHQWALRTKDTEKDSTTSDNS